MKRTGAAVLTALLVATAAGAAQDARVVLEHPAAGEVRVRSGLVYGREGDRPLTLDLYMPPGEGEPTPVVVFVLAVPDGVMEVPLKDYGQYTSWARLVAAEGMAGVVYEVTDPTTNLEAVLAFVQDQGRAHDVDPDRVALWSCSGNVALALRQLRTAGPVAVRALVAYYGFMPTPDGFRAAAMDSVADYYGMTIPLHTTDRAYPPDVPILIARAGRDRWTTGLESVDHFTAYAFEQNLPVTAINYPDGRHAFDVLDDTEDSRRVIRRTLAFLRGHLAPGPAGEEVQ